MNIPEFARRKYVGSDMESELYIQSVCAKGIFISFIYKNYWLYPKEIY